MAVSASNAVGHHPELHTISYTTGAERMIPAYGAGPVWMADGRSLMVAGSFMNHVYLEGRHIRGDYTDTAWVMMRQRGADTNTPLFRTVGFRNWVGDDTWDEVHYAGDPYLALHGDEIVVAHGASRTLAFWSLTGQHRASLQLALPRQAINSTMRQLIHDSLRQAYRTYDAQRQAAQHFADSTPLLDRLLVDATGCVWIRQWAPMNSVNHTWLAFRSPAGGGTVGSTVEATPIARMTIPRRLRVSDIGHDDVLGIDVDEDGVQAIGLAPLRRTVSCDDSASSARGR